MFFSPQELSISNVKVKRAALLAFGTLHCQLGAPFKALALSLAKPNHKSELEACFNDHPYNEALQSADWPMQSLAITSSSGNGVSSSAGMPFAVPKSDLFSKLDDDCIANLVSGQEVILI